MATYRTMRRVTLAVAISLSGSGSIGGLIEDYSRITDMKIREEWKMRLDATESIKGSLPCGSH